jgi:hypothetical protein
VGEPRETPHDATFTLTGDDPMLEQIEAATAGRVRRTHDRPTPPPQPGPLETGEPEWMQDEPDASQ